MAKNPKERKTAKITLDLFKKILKETSKIYGLPENTISYPKFNAISAGRLGKLPIERLGGYAALREYVAPSAKDNKKVDADIVARILKGAA